MRLGGRGRTGFPTKTLYLGWWNEETDVWGRGGVG